MGWTSSQKMFVNTLSQRLPRRWNVSIANSWKSSEVYGEQKSRGSGKGINEDFESKRRENGCWKRISGVGSTKSDKKGVKSRSEEKHR
jgi:hypothetical protein